MKLNFGHAASAVTVALVMMGNAFADQSSASMPGSNAGGVGTLIQPGSNPGAVNPPPPMPQNPGYNNPASSTGTPQDGMMGSPPPAPMPGEVQMSPDGLPQDDSTTTTAPPPGKSMAPPAGPMGPQNSPPPGQQSKVKVKGKQVSKR